MTHLERAVSKAVFSARAITDSKAFENVHENEMNPDRVSLVDASQMSAYLMMNLTGIPQATLFYSRDSSNTEYRHQVCQHSHRLSSVLLPWGKAATVGPESHGRAK